jgi:hypothetical protein
MPCLITPITGQGLFKVSSEGRRTNQPLVILSGVKDLKPLLTATSNGAKRVDLTAWP